MPRAKQMSAGRSSRKRFIRSLRPQTTPIGKSAAERLAVGDEIGAHAEILLRAAVREAEADKHLVEDQHDVALGADRAQPLEPFGIGVPVEMRACARCRPARNRRRRSVRMQRLQRIDQHAGDVAPRCAARAAHPRTCPSACRFRAPAPDCRRPAARRPTSRDRRRRSAPDASAGCGSAPAAPPASPLRCPTCGTTPRRARKSASGASRCRRPPDDRGRAPGRARARASAPRSMDRLVEVVAEHVDAVGAGEVVEPVAVEIGDRHAARRLHERADGRCCAHDAAELERHPVGVGELQVGNAVGSPRRCAGWSRRSASGKAPTAARSRRGGARRSRPARRRSRRSGPRRIRRTAAERASRRAMRAWPASERCLACDSSSRCFKRHHRSRERRGAEPVECECRCGPVHRIAV